MKTKIQFLDSSGMIWVECDIHDPESKDFGPVPYSRPLHVRATPAIKEEFVEDPNGWYVRFVDATPPAQKAPSLEKCMDYLQKEVKRTGIVVGLIRDLKDQEANVAVLDQQARDHQMTVAWMAQERSRLEDLEKLEMEIHQKTWETR